MNALLDQKRTVQIQPDLEFLRYLRLTPAVHEVLFAAKPTDVSWGDFCIRAMVHYVCSLQTLPGDFRGAYQTLRRLVDLVPDAAQADVSAPVPDLSERRSPDGEQRKPLRRIQ